MHHVRERRTSGAVSDEETWLPRLMELYWRQEHSVRWHIIFELRCWYREESSYLDASRGGDDSQISRTLQPSGRMYQEVRRLLKLL